MRKCCHFSVLIVAVTSCDKTLCELKGCVVTSNHIVKIHPVLFLGSLSGAKGV